MTVLVTQKYAGFVANDVSQSQDNTEQRFDNVFDDEGNICHYLCGLNT